MIFLSIEIKVIIAINIFLCNFENTVTNLTKIDRQKIATCTLRFQPQCDILLTCSYVRMHIHTCILRRADRSIASGPLHILFSDCYIGGCDISVDLHHIHLETLRLVCISTCASLVRLIAVLTQNQNF